ncbi:MAG: tRNA (guanosine(46)-N7)-methyltransferase TrmB, partial [Candidatus Puniceispirillales bacterium]
ASDDPTAKSWLLEYSLRHDHFVWQASSAADWRQPPADWPGTRYMRKAEKAGRKSAWFRFCRQ